MADITLFQLGIFTLLVVNSMALLVILRMSWKVAKIDHSVGAIEPEDQALVVNIQDIHDEMFEDDPDLLLVRRLAVRLTADKKADQYQQDSDRAKDREEDREEDRAEDLNGA